ncbi:hypothetical protein RRG08_018993 [Elysia crispata]|uniref:Uncharacterized protein n=1 Tax=Elysia crispata TaxID=231223 RepID=A0AAE1DSR3_9GAST|nr:hypothetical protein RRG08_018993 [Elysia crispata]
MSRRTARGLDCQFELRADFTLGETAEHPLSSWLCETEQTHREQTHREQTHRRATSQAPRAKFSFVFCLGRARPQPPDLAMFSQAQKTSFTLLI